MTALPQKMTTRTMARKSVRFNDTVHIAPFRSFSAEEAKDVWYSRLEMSTFVKEGREITSSYKKELQKTPVDHSEIDSDRYRGFEGNSVQRQRQRLLSNRCAVYAHKRGMDANSTAAVYKKCNEWSSDVAFVQAIHDLVATQPDSKRNSKKNKLVRRNIIPSVASLEPPTDILPLALEAFLVLQSQQKTKLERMLTLKRKFETTGIRRVRPRVC